VLVLCASLFVGGASLWHWMNRPALKLRCPGGKRPDAIAIGTVIGIGHGAMWGALRLDGENLTTKYLTSVAPDRALNDEERNAFFHRLEHPDELTPSAVGAEGHLTVAWDCPNGGFYEQELEGVYRRRFELDWLVRDPAAALSSLDPRPRKIVAAAYAVMGIVEPGD
jgi:hypothetical protein